MRLLILLLLLRQPMIIKLTSLGLTASLIGGLIGCGWSDMGYCQPKSSPCI